MYINRILVLALLLAIICYPALKDWLGSDHSAWYRYYIIWSGVVLVAWLSNRSRHPDEL